MTFKEHHLVSDARWGPNPSKELSDSCADAVNRVADEFQIRNYDLNLEMGIGTGDWLKMHWLISGKGAGTIQWQHVDQMPALSVICSGIDVRADIEARATAVAAFPTVPGMEEFISKNVAVLTKPFICTIYYGQSQFVNSFISATSHAFAMAYSAGLSPNKNLN